MAIFDYFVGKEVVLEGEKGVVCREDFSRKNLGNRIFIVKLFGTGEKICTNTKDYNFYKEDGIIKIASKDLPLASKDYRIYHSTSIDNMINIIKSGGLWSRGKLKQTEASFHDTASNSIIRKRVELGIVHTIPFHFKPKTPYEYAVFTNKAHNGHKTVPKDDMVVIDISRRKYDNCSFIFTAHPLSKIAFKYDANSNDIPNLGFWKVLDEYKNFTPGGWKNKQICMAEYDVNLDFIPLDDILEVYVQTQKKVDLLLEECVKNNKDGILKDKISIGDVHFLVK